MDTITCEGKVFRADRIPLFGVSLLVIQGARGMLGCGYVNAAAAEKFNHALAVVGGVTDYDSMLRARVQSVTSAAAALGVTPGMSGREALLKMA